MNDCLLRIPKNGQLDVLYIVVIMKIQPHHMLVSFEKDGVPQTGYISMKHLSSNDVVKCNLGTKFNIGETITAQISGYSDKHKNWYMRIKE